MKLQRHVAGVNFLALWTLNDLNFYLEVFLDLVVASSVFLMLRVYLGLDGIDFPDGLKDLIEVVLVKHELKQCLWEVVLALIELDGSTHGSNFKQLLQ